MIRGRYSGMVVTAGQQTLVAPLTAIIETLQPKRSDVHGLGGGARDPMFLLTASLLNTGDSTTAPCVAMDSPGGRFHHRVPANH